MKHFLLTTFFVLGSITVFSQQNLAETQKIETLSKVWGFLKYYHPEVAAGKYNWDEQFIGILPEIRKTENSEQLSQVYLTWLDRLETVKPCKKCNPDPDKEYFDKNFDLSWTRDSTLFTKELSSRLKYIEDNRFQGKPYYISTYNTGQIEVINEPKYENFEYPNEEYRLLALVKYWNIIEYFFPYKYMTDQDWDDALTEMIPKFSEAKDATEYHLAMLELVTKIDDTHAFLGSEYVFKYFGGKWIPAIFKIIDDKAVITSFYNDSLARLNDLRIGDVITHVDNKAVSNILEANFKYVPASNYPTKLRYSYNKVFNGSSDSLTVVFDRDGKLFKRKIARYFFNSFNFNPDAKDDERKWEILEGNIGYVRMDKIVGRNNLNVIDDLKNTKAIIFDLRKGTSASRGVSSKLNSKSKIFSNSTYPDLSYPGKFLWGRDETGSSSGKNYEGLVVILVAEGTQSQAEYVAMSLQTAENAVTIGSQTAGADGNVNPFEFLGGYKTQISGLGIYYPDRTPAQRKGVKVDIEVKPTIQGVREGRDEVLERALEYIKNRK